MDLYTDLFYGYNNNYYLTILLRYGFITYFF